MKCPREGQCSSLQRHHKSAIRIFLPVFMSNKMPQQGKGKESREKIQEMKQIKEHISIVKNLEDLCKNLPKCGAKYRCPLCPLHKFKPAWPSKVRKHLKSHDHDIRIDELGKLVLACHLECREKKKDKHAHYHCPCGRTVARRDGFDVHWEHCSQQLSLTPGIKGDSGVNTADDNGVFDVSLPTITVESILSFDSDMLEDAESVSTEDLNENDLNDIVKFLDLKKELRFSKEETCEPDNSHLEVMARPVEESEPDSQTVYGVSLMKTKALKYSQEQTNQPTSSGPVHPTHCEQADQFGKNIFFESVSGKDELMNEFVEDGSHKGEKVEAGMAPEMMFGNFHKLVSATFHDQLFDVPTYKLQDSINPCLSLHDDDPSQNDFKKEPPDHCVDNLDLMTIACTDISPMDCYLHTNSKHLDEFDKLETLDEIDDMDTDPILEDTYYFSHKLGDVEHQANNMDCWPTFMDTA